MRKNFEMSENIHSEEVHEIISTPPSWLLKVGISLIILIVLLLLGTLVFIKYPEMVRVELRFTTENSPKVIVNQVNGVLKKILVKDGETVFKGEDIAYLESTGEHEQIITLLNKLKDLRGEKINVRALKTLMSPVELSLGELQGSYEYFYNAYINFQAIQEGGIYQKRMTTLNKEVDFVDSQKVRIHQNYDLQKKELEISENEYLTYKKLFEKKIISAQELQEKEVALLSKRQAIPSIENTIINNQASMLLKSKEIAELKNEMVEGEMKFSQALNSIISEAEEWKKKYVLTSAVNGKLIYSGFWQPNQYIKSGQELFYINPSDENYYGTIYIPQNQIAKVNLGQRVIIKVRSYPFQEFGHLTGKVAYISDIPIRDSVYFARVNLIRNSKDSIINLKPGAFADSEIITSDNSIFSRIWKNLRK